VLKAGDGMEILDGQFSEQMSQAIQMDFTLF